MLCRATTKSKIMNRKSETFERMMLNLLDKIVGVCKIHKKNL